MNICPLSRQQNTADNHVKYIKDDERIFYTSRKMQEQGQKDEIKKDLKINVFLDSQDALFIPFRQKGAQKKNVNDIA